MNFLSALNSTASLIRASKRPHWLFAAVGMLCLPVTDAGAAIFDDFNDGNDVGWTRLAPLGLATATYTFPSGAYGIEAAVSPNPAALGPGRAGSYRPDEVFTDFDVSVDIVNLSLSTPETFIGLLTRVSGIGLGTTDGYALLYDFGDDSLQLLRVTNEGSDDLQVVPLALDPAKNYRLRMVGIGPLLTATIADVTAPGTPLATLGATDATYASGVAGVLVYDGSSTANQIARGTFDNFSASVPEPTGVALLALGGVYAAARRRRMAAGN